MRNTEQILKMENDCRAIITDIYPKFADVLTPFIGKKIRNADGAKCKKLDDLLDKIYDLPINVTPLTKGGNVAKHWLYLNCEKYGLYLRLSLCYTGGKYEDRTYYCEYYELSPYIGDIKDGVLVSVKQPDYPQIDIKEQLAQESKTQELKAKFEAENDKLFYGIRVKN